MTRLTDHPRNAAHRYGRDSLEVARVVNLSDAVFAIALTLLVLSLDSPDVGALLTFALAFFLVASAWWHHHRIFARLGWVEPGLIAINLGSLAGVALVPFPTRILGSAPGSRAAVMLFIALFAVLLLLMVAFMLRAQALAAWQRPFPVSLFRWVLADWASGLVIYAVCLLIAIWAPLVALAGLAVGSTLTSLTVARLGPAERREWF
jgi:uncharacterized membrane protein